MPLKSRAQQIPRPWQRRELLGPFDIPGIGSRSSDSMYSSVIVLNWNGWKDTIECLESLFRLDCPDFRVVVCDNASADGSMEKIKKWARGDLLAESANPQLSYLLAHPFTKPIPHLELTREQAESGSAAYETGLFSSRMARISALRAETMLGCATLS